MLQDYLIRELVDQSLATKLTPGSNQQVLWKCSQGHIWKAAVYSRGLNNSGCPYCSGRLPIPGKTDLATTHPELAKELVDLSRATKIKANSHKKELWICQNNHTYSASPASRTQNHSQCPYCSNRKVLIGFNDIATTHPDIVKELVNITDAHTVTAGSKQKIAWKCNQNHIYYATPAHRIKMHDTKHATGCPYCASKKVLRGFNDLATTNPDIAALCTNPQDAYLYTKGSNKVISWTCKHNHTWQSKISYMVTTHGACPYCSERKIHIGINDLATTHPTLALELVDQNLATHLKAGTNKSVEWKCPTCNGIWKTSPLSRTYNKSNCPYCAGKKVLIDFNDLATLRPDVAEHLKDTSLATTVTPGSRKKLTWICEHGHTWSATVYSQTKPNPTNCPICATNGTSKPEQELAAMIRLLLPNTEIQTNNRTILPHNKELDIVIPSKHIAIEFNGLYWHSEAAGKDKNYHKNKRIQAENANYTLIQIWEDDWTFHHDAVCRLIANKLHATNNLSKVLNTYHPNMVDTIFARKLTPCIISGHDAKTFINKNHIQGFSAATLHVALKDNHNKLRAVISIRSAKHNARMHRKAGEWEIQRYATLGHIPGGFSRLLSYAQEYIQKQGKCITTWISFSANDISNGQMYQTCGFTLKQEIAPNYYYVDLKNTPLKRQSKEAFQRKRFREDESLLWDESWTERIAAKANNLIRVWDSGKTKWVKNV